MVRLLTSGSIANGSAAWYLSVWVGRNKRFFHDHAAVNLLLLPLHDHASSKQSFPVFLPTLRFLRLCDARDALTVYRVAPPCHRTVFPISSTSTTTMKKNATLPKQHPATFASAQKRMFANLYISGTGRSYNPGFRHLFEICPIFSLGYCKRECRRQEPFFFSRVSVWVTEVRTHAVAGNRRSTGSDVAMVAILRLARVGCLFQSMLFIFSTKRLSRQRDAAEASTIT